MDLRIDKEILVVALSNLDDLLRSVAATVDDKIGFGAWVCVAAAMSKSASCH